MSNDNIETERSMRTAIVNFGGKLAANQEYVFKLENIEMTPNVIQYPKNLTLDATKHKRTLESLTADERKMLEAAPEEPMTNANKEVVLNKKTGEPVMKSKVQDEIRFILVNDETGIRTGPYDLVFKCYPGFRPGNDFKAFLQNLRGIDADTLSGNKNLFDLFPIGSKYVISTKAELRDGKWAQLNVKTIKPYIDGMELSKAATTEEVAADETKIEGEILRFIETGKINPLVMVETIAKGQFGDKAIATKLYNRLKGDGTIGVEDNFLVVKI